MDTIAQLLELGRETLTPVSPTASLDSELLLAEALGRPRSHLYAWPQQPVAGEQRRRFEQLLQRRRRGEPVAYLLGRREFWSRPFRVAPGVLIPRPETELLVEQALRHLPEREPRLVADLGTGSGAIAVTLALERPAARIIATDISPRALALARSNAVALGAGNVILVRSDWAAPLPRGRFDLVVSNPPYVSENDVHLRGEIRFEPATALVAGRDGLDAYRRLIPQAHACLGPEGRLLLEHGHTQAEAVARLLERAGFTHIRCHHDLQGHPRVTLAQKET